MAAHRYWRWYFTAGSTGYVTLSEVELRTSIGGLDVTGSGTPSADSIYSASYPASNAFDNNDATQWTSGGAYPHWLKYDFGESNEKDIVQYLLRVKTSDVTDVPTTWQFQYSDDAVSWVSVDQRTGYGWLAGLVRLFTVGEYTICSRIATFLLRRDMEFGGRYQIKGVARSLGNGAKMRLRLFDKYTGMLLREMWSSSTGDYVFDNLAYKLNGYTLIAYKNDTDTSDARLSAVIDRITPELMP